MLGAPIGVTSDAQASWWGGRGVGTVPHALIASYGGNTVLAATKFAEWASDDMNIVVLVDFENDSVRTALEVARALGPRLWGVRLDTSGQLVDRSLWDELGDFDPRGVNERLVRKVRDALDADGFEQREDRRLRRLHGREDQGRSRSDGVPVDAYGVGSSLIRGQNDFTADVVMTDGRPSAKVGRRYRPNPRLELRHARRGPSEPRRRRPGHSGQRLGRSGRRARRPPRSGRTRRRPRPCSRPPGTTTGDVQSSSR